MKEERYLRSAVNSLVSNAEIIFRLETQPQGLPRVAEQLKAGEVRGGFVLPSSLFTGSQKATFKTNKPGLRSRLLTEGSDLEEKKKKDFKEVPLGSGARYGGYLTFNLFSFTKQIKNK